MAAQDERVWGADVDAFRVRDPALYAKHSIMFADPALQGGDNAAPHSHACPAKALALQLATGFFRRLAARAWTADTNDGVKIHEYGGGAVVLTKRAETCAEARARGARCIEGSDGKKTEL